MLGSSKKLELEEELDLESNMNLDDKVNLLDSLIIQNDLALEEELLNMTVNNTAASASDFALRANVGSTDSVYIMNHAGTSIAPYQTFVFSDKFVLSPDNELQVYSSQNADIYFSYIYQDWT